MKKVILFSILIAISFAMKLRSGYRSKHRKFSMKHKTKIYEDAWYFVFQTSGTNRYLRANAHVETLGIVAEPIYTGDPDGHVELPFGFGDGAIKMSTLHESIEDSNKYLEMAELLKLGKLHTEPVNSPLRIEIRAKIMKDYDNPSTTFKNIGGKNVEVPYHPGSILLPNRFINKCHINIDAAKPFLFPVKELTTEEQGTFNLLHPPEIKPKDPNVGISVGGSTSNQPTTMEIKRQYTFELIDPSKVANPKCQLAETVELPFTKVLLFPTPVSSNVVPEKGSEELVKSCQANIQHYQDTIKNYGNAIDTLNIVYDQEVLLFKLKAGLSSLFGKWKSQSESLLEFFSSDGLGVPLIKDAVNKLNMFVDISSDWSSTDIHVFVKRYDEPGAKPQNTLKEFANFKDPFIAFDCIKGLDCEIKTITEEQLLKDINLH